jgi:hypothetical protein
VCEFARSLEYVTIRIRQYDDTVRAVVALSVSLIACSDPPGLTLEVTSDDPNVARVELFVGTYCEGNCPGGVVPPGMTPKPVDGMYLVDDTAPWGAPMSGGIAGFRIAPLDHELKLAIVLAVGYDATDQPVATAAGYNVELVPGDAVYARMALLPAEPLVDMFGEPTPPSGTRRVKLWHQPSGSLPACVLVEEWSGSEARRDVVVPETDRDCDQARNECQAWAYLASGSPAGIEQANCFRLDTQISPNGTCMLGGPLCNEQSTLPPTGCEHLDTQYCAPIDLCRSCEPLWDPACTRTAIATGIELQHMAHLACTFPLDDAGKPCASEVAVDNIDAAAITGTGECKSVGVSKFGIPFGPFSSNVMTPLGQLGLSLRSQPCTVEVKWQPVDMPVDRFDLAFVDLELDNTNHLFMPAAISLVTGCSQPASCTFAVGDTTDPMLACAQQDLAAQSCQPSGDCDFGPSCGGVCCGKGERCFDGVCGCGESGVQCTNGDQCTPSYFSDLGCGSLCCGKTTLCPVTMNPP